MEKKVHFKLHKVKKHWVTIAVTGLALGLSFAGLNYASAEEQPTPVNEATVEAIIKEGAIDVEAPATSETTAKPAENTPTTASSEAATVAETPTASSEVASAETVSEKPSSEVTNTSSSEAASSETTSSETAHSEVSASPEVVEKTVVTGGQYTSDDQGNWYYVKDGKALTGLQTIDYVDVYFDADGKQVKDDTRQIDGSTYHFAKDSGQITRNAFASDKMGNWYYFGPDGKALIFDQVVNGQHLYFHSNGKQAKGELVTVDGKIHYYDANSGARLSNIDITIKGESYHFDADGNGTLIS